MARFAKRYIIEDEKNIIFYVLSKVKYYAGRKRGNSYLLFSRLLKSNVIIITVTAMMMLSTLTFLSTLIFGSSQAGLWSYKGDSSPEFWSEHFPICGGDSQSPIDLASDSASKTHTKNTAKV